MTADPARFLPTFCYQVKRMCRLCEVSAVNLTSNCVAQLLLGFCRQSTVIIVYKSISITATDLQSNYVSRFCNISGDILLSLIDTTDFVYNLQSFC